MGRAHSSGLPADSEAPRLSISDEREAGGYVAAHLSRRPARVAVNALFLLANFGHCSQGPANPSHAERLDRRIAKGRKRGLDTSANEDERLCIPEWIDFASEVILRDSRQVHAPSREGGHENRHEPVRPHWRRGHFRTQRHGHGHALKKTIFIRPVLVNGHLLPEGATPAVSYRLSENFDE